MMTESKQSCPTSSQSFPEVTNLPKKPSKPSTVTPRRFKKFFTPVSASRGQRCVRTSRRALQNITNPPGKRKHEPRSLGLVSYDCDLENEQHTLLKGARGSKRKLSFASCESPPLSSPLRPDPYFLSSSQHDHGDTVWGRDWSAEPTASQRHVCGQNAIVEDESETERLSDQSVAIQPFHTLSRSSHILFHRLSGRSKKREPRSSRVWQCETASFYSSARDTYRCDSQAYWHPALPFCSASCNTNSLVAIGDEEGGVRLLDSASGIPDGFSKAYLTFKPHDNAIMDLAFSDDDTLLATGSGDQSCRIIDMLTQQTLHTLSGHSSSIKRVQFQPESRNNIMASCSRDGNVNIWDLRTQSVNRPARQLSRASQVGMEDQGTGFNMPAASLRDCIRAAHSDRDQSRKTALPKSKPNHRREEASITSIVFLGGGREHLLATSSEADATVKLWDMRTTYDTRRARPLPLSTTRQPESHETHRRFGLTSMALSTDGARLYTLCRDHTIYAYSTSHLILGNAAELSKDSIRPRRAGGAEREGLGPLYGFRHRQLQASTFYVKLSVRKHKDDKTELLAAGSGSDCAILFPTNERYLGCKSRPQSRFDQVARPCLGRLDSGSEIAPSLDDMIPIYQHGTALIRGHRKEVTAVAWTSAGELVTVSDDFHVRCWREGEEARGLRTGGEGQGKRWMCGWADVDGSYDSDE